MFCSVVSPPDALARLALLVLAVKCRVQRVFTALGTANSNFICTLNWIQSDAPKSVIAKMVAVATQSRANAAAHPDSVAPNARKFVLRADMANSAERSANVLRARPNAIRALDNAFAGLERIKTRIQFQFAFKARPNRPNMRPGMSPGQVRVQLLVGVRLSWSGWL